MEIIQLYLLSMKIQNKYGSRIQISVEKCIKKIYCTIFDFQVLIIRILILTIG